MTLAVTAADLRLGQGYVRCGRCMNVFNALLTLSEEPVDTSAAPLQADPASTSQITSALSSAAAAATGIDDSQEVEIPPESPGTATAADGPPMQLVTERSSDGAIENESSLADGTGTFETIVLEGDTISQTEEFVPEESVDSEIAALTQRLGIAANEPVVSPPYPHTGVPGLSAPLGPAEADSDALDLDIATIAKPARRDGAVVIGCAALVLLLIIQAVNHWRDALATSPLLGGALTRLYATLGVPINPHWNLAAYDIRQQGAVVDAIDSHVIRVRLSIANRAQRAQPVPMVRLTLLDRYGKRVASRDMTPGEYWPRAQKVADYLARDQRVDTEVAVRDPDSDSASFELDVCLKNGRGALHCAGDAGAATADAHP